MDWKSEMERIVSNLAPSKQAEVRFFIENLLEQERKRILSLPFMEEEEERMPAGHLDRDTVKRNNLRRELKEEINI